MIDEKAKRKLFWSITLAAPLLLLLGLEGLLRMVKFGEPLDLVFVNKYQDREYYTVNRSLARRYFPRQSIQPPGVYDCTFEVTKAPNTYRIFLLGESTMQGFPYEYNGALHRLLGDRLMQLFPERKIEVVNLGITAVNSFAVLDLMREVVNYKPDLIILYVGHNEFYGSFGAGSSEYIGKSRILINLYLRIEHLKIVQLLERIIGFVRSMLRSNPADKLPPGFMETLAREKAISYGSQVYATVRENFKWNLTDIADIAANRQIPLMLSTVICNLRDQPPFVSDFSVTTSADAKTQWSALVSRGKDEQNKGHCDSATALYAKALLIDSTYAELHYAMGICLEELGELSEARRHLSLARDFDLLRFRATDEFNAIIKEVASSKKLMLADIEKTFEDSSANRIVGRRLMLEHVHPNLDGYFLIAKEYVRLMKEYDCLAPTSRWRAPLPDDDYKSSSLMTQFDFEVSILRIDNLMHHWPFSAPESTRYHPVSDEGHIAMEYLQGKTDWEHAHYTLADMYKSQNRYADAEREYLAVAKVMGFDVNPMLLAGDMNLIARNFARAESIYRLAMRREDNQYVHLRFGELFSQTGRTDSAIASYRGALERDGNAASKMTSDWKLELRQHLAEEYVKKHDIDRAREQLFAILSENPRYPKARRLLDSLSALSDADNVP